MPFRGTDRPGGLRVVARPAAAAPGVGCRQRHAPSRRRPLTGQRWRCLPSSGRLEVVSRDGMVVTGNAAASWAAARILEVGGNAIDAAVAAAFAWAWPSRDRPASAARRTSSSAWRRACRRHRRLGPFPVARIGRRSSPGCATAPRRSSSSRATSRSPPRAAWPALDLALRSYGTKTPRRGGRAGDRDRRVRFDVVGGAARLPRELLDEGEGVALPEPAVPERGRLDVWDPDHVYCNPDLACFLRRLAAVGADDFYRGAIAAEIERDMIANGGWLRRADLALLEATVREPVRGSYRGLEVLSFPFPGGGSTVVETLGILDRFDPRVLRDGLGRPPPPARRGGPLAMVDTFPARRPRALPDQIAVDAAHLDARAALIRFDRALRRREISLGAALDASRSRGTAHVSVADRFGNAVALTQTLGASFGGGAVTEGLRLRLQQPDPRLRLQEPRLVGVPQAAAGADDQHGADHRRQGRRAAADPRQRRHRPHPPPAIVPP